MESLAAQTIIDERYELIEHLGDGGMGSVYLSREIGLERRIAVKLLHRVLASDNESRVRFAREGKLLSVLSHPNLLQIYRLGIWNDTPYIAMEYLEGRNLAELISERGALSFEEMIKIIVPVCDAMELVHRQDIIHRDLKPTNIFVTTDGGVKVLDFGLARLVNSQTESQALTVTGQVIGSLHYLSPEQCLGRQVNRLSDIYALGCVIYECVTGAPPFTSESPVAIIEHHVARPYPGVASRKNLPAALDQVLYKALAKEPEQRYNTMEALKSDLLKVASGSFVSTGFVAGKRRSSSIKLVALVFALLSLCSIGLFFNRPSEKPVWRVPHRKLSEALEEAEHTAALFQKATSDEQKRRFAIGLDRQVHALVTTNAGEDDHRKRVQAILELQTKESWKYLENGPSQVVYYWMDLGAIEHYRYVYAGRQPAQLSRVRYCMNQALACWKKSLSPQAGMNLRLRRAILELEADNVAEAKRELAYVLPVMKDLDGKLKGIGAGSVGSLHGKNPNINKLVDFVKDIRMALAVIDHYAPEQRVGLCEMLLSICDYCISTGSSHEDTQYLVESANYYLAEALNHRSSLSTQQVQRLDVVRSGLEKLQNKKEE